MIYNYSRFLLLLQRLFFLNGEQDLSSFVLVNMGIVKYPSYKCIITERIFSCQVELLAYEEVFVSMRTNINIL